MRVLGLALFTISLALAVEDARAQRIEFPPPQVGAPAVTTAIAHEFVTAFPTPGSPLTQAQPAFTDISGSLAAAQCPNGTTLATGCLEVGGGLSVASGIVQLGAVSGTTHEWFSSVSSGGVLTPTQPAAADLSNGTTGSGAVVLVTSPTLVTPVLGVAAATTINKMAITAPATSSTLAVADGKTLTASNTLTLAGTDSSVLTFHGNFTTAGAVTTTGTGPTTLAFPNSSETLTFPTSTDTIPGLAQSNIFTATQTVNFNGAAVLSGLGTTSHLTLQGANAAQVGLNLVSAAGANQFRFFRVDNTIASPTALGSSETIGSITWDGWNGTALTFGGRVTAITTEGWGGSATGTQVQIQATPTGTTGGETEAIFQAGLVVGTAGTAEGVGTVNAASGYWSNGVKVIDASQAATFAGGLTATIGLSTAALNYACYNASTHVFTYDNSSTCLVSSLRFKHDVRPVEGAINTVMRLDPIDFVYNDQSNQPGRQMGLSAESVASAVPYLATFDKDGRPERVKYLEVIGLLTAAVQEQQREIESLKPVGQH